MAVILKAFELGKRYRLSGSSDPYQTLRETIVALPRAAVRRLRGRQSPPRMLWALKDVNFEVAPGEVVGVIGRNGAGKSTLLKLLSRVTDPTTGGIDLYGRVGSLLEVGAGFHPELTGRENIFLNGAVLGMRRSEIRRQFDEIVAFAEVERMLDTPIKRYSSGMFVRLAFAVAAHLQTEILLVDEVLAVGDASFQKKCLGKMSDVTERGRTVVLVSHQMGAIRAICDRVLWIHEGRIRSDGPPADTIDAYMRDADSAAGSVRLWTPSEQAEDGTILLRSMAIRDALGRPLSTGFTDQALRLEMEFDLRSLPSGLCIGFDLVHQDGTVVLRSSHNDEAEADWPPLHLGRNRLSCTIPPGLLSFGTYHLVPRIGIHGVRWLVNDARGVSIDLRLNHSASPYWIAERRDKFPGVISPCFRWEQLLEDPASTQTDGTRGHTAFSVEAS
jgi:lipopolysaccharide transport system ATP-binding protein